MAKLMTVGQRIKSGGNEWEVLGFEADGDMRILVRSVESPVYARYLNAGQEYLVFKHESSSSTWEVWEIRSEHMKRSVSQMLLFLDGANEPEIELDT